MKSVIIVRHAKSSWNHPNLSDHERPLNARGARDAPRMAEYLARSRYCPQQLVVSSAVRAQQTAQYFQTACAIKDEHCSTEPELYHAGMREWILMLEKYWHIPEPVAFFAHNPGITHMVNWLCEQDIFNIPTCAVAIIGFPEDLQRIDSGVGTLIDLQVPKALA